MATSSLPAAAALPQPAPLASSSASLLPAELDSGLMALRSAVSEAFTSPTVTGPIVDAVCSRLEPQLLQLDRRLTLVEGGLQQVRQEQHQQQQHIQDLFAATLPSGSFFYNTPDQGEQQFQQYCSQYRLFARGEAFVSWTPALTCSFATALGLPPHTYSLKPVPPRHYVLQFTDTEHRALLLASQDAQTALGRLGYKLGPSTSP